MTHTIEFADDLNEAEVELLRRVAKTIQNLRYGSVTITVHDGHIVEFQRNEKFRVRT